MDHFGARPSAGGTREDRAVQRAPTDPRVVGMRRPSARMKHASGVQGLFVIFGFAIAAFFPYRAIYLADRGLSSSEIGLVISIMAVAGTICGPIWGHFAD